MVIQTKISNQFPTINEDIFVEFNNAIHIVRRVQGLNDDFYWHIEPNNPLLKETKLFILDNDFFQYGKRISFDWNLKQLTINWHTLNLLFEEKLLQFPFLHPKTFIVGLSFVQRFKLQNTIEENIDLTFLITICKSNFTINQMLNNFNNQNESIEIIKTILVENLDLTLLIYNSFQYIENEEIFNNKMDLIMLMVKDLLKQQLNVIR